MDVWKCFFLSLCYKSLIVRPRNRFISQDYDVYVYAHIFTIQNFVAVFVPLMPLAWCCTPFIERLQHLNFLPASLFLQRQVNFLNQINDNRNKIDMLLLLLLLLQTNWVQIFLSDGCKAHNRLEKKHCVDVCFALLLLQIRLRLCVRMKLTSHSSNRAFHYIVAVSSAWLQLSTFYMLSLHKYFAPLKWFCYLCFDACRKWYTFWRNNNTCYGVNLSFQIADVCLCGESNVTSKQQREREEIRKNTHQMLWLCFSIKAVSSRGPQTYIQSQVNIYFDWEHMANCIIFSIILAWCFACIFVYIWDKPFQSTPNILSHISVLISLFVHFTFFLIFDFFFVGIVDMYDLHFVLPCIHNNRVFACNITRSLRIVPNQNQNYFPRFT